MNNLKTYFWSCKPGKYVDIKTGQHISNNSKEVSHRNLDEWHETLFDSIRHFGSVMADPANVIVASPQVVSILNKAMDWREYGENLKETNCLPVGILNYSDLLVYCEPKFANDRLVVCAEYYRPLYEIKVLDIHLVK